MDKFKIVERIDRFAPAETAEPWDCSGWLVMTKRKAVNKILLTLTVTKQVFDEAVRLGCDMIISHHPLFFVPVEYREVDIYCAHTNLDLAKGGTTDVLISNLKDFGLPVKNVDLKEWDFVRYVETEISVEKFVELLSKISPNLRYVNLQGCKILTKIAFCAGSGSEFIQSAFDNGACAFVTGDLKFHTALDSPIPVFDIGHFESEVGVLKVFETLISGECEVVYATEKSPFCYTNIR